MEQASSFPDRESISRILDALCYETYIELSRIQVDPTLKALASAWNESIFQKWSIDDKVAIATLIVKRVDELYRSDQESRGKERG